MINQKFTIEEIRNYLNSQDSFGDAIYNLNAENIKAANEPEPIDEYEDTMYHKAVNRKRYHGDDFTASAT